MADDENPPGPDDPFGLDPGAWVAAEAREIERRLNALLETVERLADERIESAREAAEAIVNAALREAEEIRRVAMQNRLSAMPRPTEAAEESMPSRARLFVGGGEVEKARRLAEELMLGGLGRARIESEVAGRFPELSRDRVDAIVSSLLIPPTGPESANG